MSPEQELQMASQMLSELVACPSVNPNNRPVSGPPYGEEALDRLLSKMLTSWGAKTTMPEVMPDRYNLVAHFPGRKSSKSLMLEAHADTVEVEKMTIAPFVPVVENGKLYGRGACDTKGSMAAMLLAIKSVLDRDGQPPIDLYFVAACNEERGADGAHRLMEDGFRPDAAIVGEPTELEIVNFHKGVVRWKVGTHGVAAHSSLPSAGVNAIYKMARFVERVEGELSKKLAQRTHPRLGAPVISVGTIRGGSQVNIVPAHCSVEIDRRIIPSESLDEVTREVTEVLSHLATEDAQFKYEIEQVEWYPPLEQEADSPIVHAMAQSCKRALGEARFGAVGWAADAGIYKHYGVPSVVFGPGNIRQAHTGNEFIELDQVVQASHVLADVIRTFHG